MIQLLIWLLILLFSRVSNQLPVYNPLNPEARAAVAYGLDVFEPGMWTISVRETPDRVFVTWTADLVGGLSYVDYMRNGTPQFPDVLDTYFNKHWFEVTFSNYQSWKERAYCQFDNLRLFEFDVVTSYGVEYRLRYWVQYVDPDHLATIFVTFPISDETNLNKYAERLFPAASSCEPAR